MAMTPWTNFTPTMTSLPPSSTDILNVLVNESLTTVTVNNSNDSVISEEERRRYLEKIQAETTIVLIPNMVFLVLLGVTGLVGNSLVLIVFSSKFKRTSTRILIMTIASFDLVTNLITIPTEVVDKLHSWDFDNPPLCRARLFFNALTTLSSGMILVAVAVVRYRKVCAPYGWQVSIKQAKIISVIIAFLAVLFAIPYAITNGRQTKETPRAGIYGYECTTDDSYKNTIWPILNNGFFMLLFVLCCTSLTVMYIKIGIQAWRHSKQHKILTASTAAMTPINSSASGTPEVSINNDENGKSAAAQSPKRSKKLKILDYAKSYGSSNASSGYSTDVTQGVSSDYNEAFEVQQYTMQIHGERLEIRTHVMNEIVLQLRQSVKEDKDVLNPHQNVEYEPHNIVLDNKDHCGDSKRVPDTCDLQTLMQDHSGLGNLDTYYDNSAFISGDEIGDKLFDDKNMTKEIHEGLGAGDMTVDAETTITNTPENSKVKTEAVIMQSTSSIENMPVDFPEDRDSAVVMMDRVIGDQAAVDDNTIKGCREKNGDQTMNSADLDIDHAQTDKDPLAALNWVELVYCPKGTQSKGASDSSAMITNVDANFPFCIRLSPTNDFIRKTKSLRAKISDALVKSKTKDNDTTETEKTIDIVRVFMEENFETHNENNNVKCSGTTGGSAQNNHWLKKSAGTENNFSRILFKENAGSPSPSQRLKKRIDAEDKARRSSLSSERSGRRGSRTSGTRKRPMGRTTAKLITISAVFYVGFLPYLGLNFYRFSSPKTFEAMTDPEMAVAQLFLNSYLLNCAVNPIVYSLFDVHFRRECLRLFRLCTCRKP